MYCPQCGSENPDDSNFCTSCGKNLENMENKQTENMNKNLKCPECGCENIGTGTFSGYASLSQYEFKFFPRSSDVLADVCSNCGYILKLRVKEPHLFKSKS